MGSAMNVVSIAGASCDGRQRTCWQVFEDAGTSFVWYAGKMPDRPDSMLGGLASACDVGRREARRPKGPLAMRRNVFAICSSFGVSSF